MGRPPAHDPIRETEYLVHLPVDAAEEDGALARVASTWLPQEDRLVMGTGRPGTRLVDFAPLLKTRALPFNEAVRGLLAACAEAAGTAVEIEFAATLGPDDGRPARIGFLQVRPMAAAGERIDVCDADLADPAARIASTRTLGNGEIAGIADVVYVSPRAFDPMRTREIAEEIADLNAALLEAGRPYLLVGLGRWGSSEPTLGVPVAWGQISGARVIVEATLPSMDVELSQGSHFFHNITSLGVLYFSVPHGGPRGIDWGWLDRLPVAREGRFVRHARCDRPLRVRVDGRTGKGFVRS
jgi:hypothetical protein